MKAREYDVLARAVEDGVAYGWTRAHKHVPDPDEVSVRIEITALVISEICEWFDFESPAPQEQEDE